MTQLSIPREFDQVEYHPGPSVLIFSDDPERLAWFGRMVAREGGRISAALPLGDAVGRIADHAAPDGVIADLEFAGASAVDGILESLEEGARSHRFASIALIHGGMIDVAAARAGHHDVQLLCSPDQPHVAGAVARMLTPRVLALNDVTADRGTARLRELSDEVSRIAQALAALSERQREVLSKRDGAADLPIDAPVIRAMIRARRMREQFFPAELFADPAWDMLLDLAAARLEGRTVAVSSLCIAAAVPPTTALRWIKTLTDLGMFVRVADPRDRRRIFIELSSDMAETVLECLSATRQMAAGV